MNWMSSLDPGSFRGGAVDFQLRPFSKYLNAARSIIFRVLFRAYQASNVELAGLLSVPRISVPKPTPVAGGE